MDASRAVIPSDAIEIDTSECLGSGAVGVVYKAKYANETVVVKRLKMQSLSKAAEDEFKQEANMLAQLNHPRIVRFMGVVIDKDQYSLVLEYLSLGSLYHFYTTKPKLPYANRLSLATDIASGMAYLHRFNPPVFHRDMKSLNILLYIDAAGELHCKITDFGVAMIRQSALTTTLTLSTTSLHSQQQKGTLIWMAPELHSLRAVYRSSCDVYSFGVVLSELFSWVGPFGIPTAELRYEVLHHMLTVDKRVPDVELDEDVPSPVLKLIEQCISMDPKLRPPFSDIALKLSQFGGELQVQQAAEVGVLVHPSAALGVAVVATEVFQVTETEISRGTSENDIHAGSLSSQNPTVSFTTTSGSSVEVSRSLPPIPHVEEGNLSKGLVTAD
ncbi:hypothetical protein HDU67_003855 [Dinochytrium kinnereticum]|nr:hypothetical protein HDU67_003855 [Dinochytrium kinnereticum]